MTRKTEITKQTIGAPEDRTNTARSVDDLTLSELRGSVKQIAWANKIRTEKLARLLTEIDGTKVAKDAWDAGCENEDAFSRTFMVPLLQREQTALDFLTKIESAKFWIETRSLKVKDFFSVRGMVTDMIGAALKLIEDARKSPEQLKGYDLENLLEFIGQDYREWFEKNKFEPAD